MAEPTPTMYEQYIRTRELLRLQPDPPVHHDELLFQVAHQVMELWFKVGMHEVAGAAAHCAAARPLQAAALLERCARIIVSLRDQLAIVETMPVAHFHAFRPLLVGGSGEQSPGFNAFAEAARPLWEAISGLLGGRGVSAYAVMADPGAHPDLHLLLTGALNVDEAFWQWRATHLVMVARFLSFNVPSTVGRPTNYLWGGLHTRLFPALWQAIEQVAQVHPLDHGATGPGECPIHRPGSGTDPGQDPGASGL